MVGLAILLTVLFAVGWRLLSDVLPEGWAVVVLLAVLALVATCGGLVVARVVRGRSLESPEPPAGDEFEHQ